MGNKKRRHHYVWQMYLDAWTDNGSIWCKNSSGTLFKTDTKNIAVQRDLYRLHELTSDEIGLLRHFISKGHPKLIRLHNLLLDDLMAPFVIAKNDGKADDPSYKERLEEYSSNILEDQHTAIENSFQPLLIRLREGDTSFYASERDSIIFFHYLAHQYSRTKRIADNVAVGLAENGLDYGARISPILSHVVGNNVAASLCMQRQSRSLAMLTNQSILPFITGDQPAVNLLPYEDGFFEIFYPLSPTRAIVLGDIGRIQTDRILTSDAEVMILNERIRSARHHQLYGNVADIL